MFDLSGTVIRSTIPLAKGGTIVLALESNEPFELARPVGGRSGHHQVPAQQCTAELPCEGTFIANALL